MKEILWECFQWGNSLLDQTRMTSLFLLFLFPSKSKICCSWWLSCKKIHIMFTSCYFLLDRLQYMHQLNSAAQQLIMLGHPNDQIASLVWSSLGVYMPKWISKYCRKQVPNFDEEFGSDVSTWLCVNGLPKCHQFYSFMISQTRTDAFIWLIWWNLFNICPFTP